MIFFTQEQLDQLIRHSRAMLPDEACGILAGKGRVVMEIYEMTNTDKSPTTYFMDPGEQLRVMKDMRSKGLEMVGIYHSHVGSPAYPSRRDTELAFYPEAAYVIISLESPDSPVVRAFRIVEGKVVEDGVSKREADEAQAK